MSVMGRLGVGDVLLCRIFSNMESLNTGRKVLAEDQQISVSGIRMCCWIHSGLNDESEKSKISPVSILILA